MRTPALSKVDSSYVTLDSFGGINRTPSADPRDLYDGQNLVLDDFPAVRSRKKANIERHIYPRPTSMLFADGKLIYTSGTSLFIDGAALFTELDPGDKSLVLFGSKVCVFPDGYYVDLYSLDRGGEAVRGYLSNLRSMSDAGALCVPSTEDSFDKTTVSSAEPHEADVLWWYDTSKTPGELKHRPDSASGWTVFEPTHTSILSSGIGAGFNERDGVFVESDIDALNTSALVASVKENALLLSFRTERAYTLFYGSNELRVSRPVPRLERAAAYKNRLCGARYGTDENGETFNEIVLSRLGDPFNWNVFDGGIDDSYRASVSSFGPFTGVAVQSGYVLFFKEDRVYRLMGDRPSNFTLNEHLTEGVGPGFTHTLVSDGDALYFMNRRGIFSFGGNTATLISSPLGDAVFTEGEAGVFRGRVFFSVRGDFGEKTYSYSPAKRFFEPYSNSYFALYAPAYDCIYALMLRDGNVVLEKLEYGEDGNEVPGWGLVTQEFGKESFGHYLISEVTLRIRLSTPADVRIYAEYDGSGERELIGRADGNDGEVVSLTSALPRHDKVRFHLYGYGGMELFSLSFRIERTKGRVRG